MNEHPAGRDPWIVRIGDYHFGPFEGQTAARKFVKTHGGITWPLFGQDEEDVLDGEPWLDQAKAQA